MPRPGTPRENKDIWRVKRTCLSKHFSMLVKQLGWGLRGLLMRCATALALVSCHNSWIVREAASVHCTSWPKECIKGIECSSSKWKCPRRPKPDAKMWCDLVADTCACCKVHKGTDLRRQMTIFCCFLSGCGFSALLWFLWFSARTYENVRFPNAFFSVQKGWIC